MKGKRKYAVCGFRTGLPRFVTIVDEKRETPNRPLGSIYLSSGSSVYRRSTYSINTGSRGTKSKIPLGVRTSGIHKRRLSPRPGGMAVHSPVQREPRLFLPGVFAYISCSARTGRAIVLEKREKKKRKSKERMRAGQPILWSWKTSIPADSQGDCSRPEISTRGAREETERNSRGNKGQTEKKSLPLFLWFVRGAKARRILKNEGKTRLAKSVRRWFIPKKKE